MIPQSDPLELTLRPPLPQEIQKMPQKFQSQVSFDQFRTNYPIFNSVETENSNPPESHMSNPPESQMSNPPESDMSNPPKSHMSNPPESYMSGVGIRGSRKRKAPPTKRRKEGKTETIPKPYNWAQSRRANIYSFEELKSMGITKIEGSVHCKKCDKTYNMGYDLETKFNETASYIAKNKSSMHDRAPSKWMTPILPDCEKCGHKNCVKPVISKKRKINWLFLLLGEMLGCCKLSELKYFCKHTENHRTGAKDRVLYLTYLGLCKQLDPTGPFSLDD